MNTRRTRETGLHLGALVVLLSLVLALLAVFSSTGRLVGSRDEPRTSAEVAVTPAPAPAVVDVAPPPPTPPVPAAAPEAAPAVEEPQPRAPAVTAPRVVARQVPPTARPPVAPRQRADVTPPTSPQDVTASANDVSVDVTWRSSSDDVGVTAYEVEREGGEGWEPAVVATAAYTDVGLRPRVEYCYTVVAIDAAGNRSAPSPRACAITRDILPPTVPDHVKATVVDSRTILLRWAPSTDDAGGVEYEVLDNDAVVAVVLNGTGWKGRVEEHSEHRYAIRAVDDAGNRSLPSQPVFVSLADSDPPTTPRDFKVTPSSSTRLSLEWLPSQDDVAVVAYEVLKDSTVVVRSPGTTATISGLGEYEELCLSVRAVDAAGNRSMLTLPVCGRTLPLERTEGDRRVVTIPGVQRRQQ